MNGLTLPAVSAGVIAGAGMVQAAAGFWAVRRFQRAQQHPAVSDALPPVTILKPLHGDEPLLQQALDTFCRQDYPQYQIVFGLQDAADPALHVLRRLRANYPNLDMQIVVDATQHGTNRKIGNLMNMLPSARHDVLVVSDSDIHVTPDYLRRVVATLDQPGAGLVTTLYAGLPFNDHLPARFGASQINHAFLPGVILARWLGRQACLGATMALRRSTLDAIGGFGAVASQLADDAMLGQLVNTAGLDVRLAPTLTATTVPEGDAASLFHHELRWARTTRSLAPIPYAMSLIQYPLFWAMLAVALSGGAPAAGVLFAMAWLVRALAATGIDRMLQLESAVPIWLLPVRDMLSVTVILLSYGSDNVQWRGQMMSAARPRLMPGKG